MKNKRILPLLLSLALVFSLCACGSSGGTGKGTDQNASGNDPQAMTETRIITDALGRQVEIPATVERIVPLGSTPRMIAYLGLADKVVGIGDCEIKIDGPIQAYAYVNHELWKDLPIVGTDALGDTAFYPEELISVAPDIIVCSYTEDVVNNIVSQTGLPVVAVAQGTLLGEDYEQSLRIIGEACGVSQRAEAVISFINDAVADLEERTEDIPDEDKPLVLGAAATFSGAHSIDGVYIDYPVFRVLNANDAAKGVQGTSYAFATLVDKEQILAWDPDKIFLDAGSMALVKVDYQSDPEYFKQLKAIQNGELYQWPNSTWHYTNVEIPLVSSYYTGALLYPEAFADVDFESKASEIFDFFLGDPDFLSTLEDFGAGYEKITLGE